MKKFAILTLTFSAIAISAFALEKEKSIVNFHELNEDIMHTLISDNALIVEFPKGSKLPLQGILTGDLLTILDGQVTTQVEVQQTFYVKYQYNDLYVSSDLVNWKPLFFEFITGEASLKMGVVENTPTITISADINKR